MGFVATSLIFVIFAALGVRIARRLRRDRERNKNIIEADWSPVEDKSGETDLTLR